MRSLLTLISCYFLSVAAMAEAVTPRVTDLTVTFPKLPNMAHSPVVANATWMSSQERCDSLDACYKSPPLTEEGMACGGITLLYSSAHQPAPRDMVMFRRYTYETWVPINGKSVVHQVYGIK